MFTRCTRTAGRVVFRRCAPALLAAFAILAASPLKAQDEPKITIGAWLRTGFVHTDADFVGDNTTDDFAVNNARIYLGGSVTKQIKFMFNTDYSSNDNKIGVLDAVARIEVAPMFNIWVGRFLPPSDRANLYG